MQSLEAEFHEAMLAIYKAAIEACNYRARAFLSMVVEMGGLRAAKTLLSTDEPQSGLYELHRCGRLDLTVETLVTQPRFRSLFEDAELEEAERRLVSLGQGSKPGAA